MVRVGILWCFQKCSILKPFTMTEYKLSLCFGWVVMSIYQSIITLHSPNSKHWWERTSRKDPKLRKRYADKIRYDLRKGYVTTVEPHDISKPSDREW